nr:MAG TPA: hypothetical protein [Bacteriophage sp.]
MRSAGSTPIIIIHIIFITFILMHFGYSAYPIH